MSIYFVFPRLSSRQTKYSANNHFTIKDFFFFLRITYIILFLSFDFYLHVHNQGVIQMIVLVTINANVLLRIDFSSVIISMLSLLKNE